MGRYEALLMVLGLVAAVDSRAGMPKIGSSALEAMEPSEAPAARPAAPKPAPRAVARPAAAPAQPHVAAPAAPPAGYVPVPQAGAPVPAVISPATQAAHGAAVIRATTEPPRQPAFKRWGVTGSINFPHPLFVDIEHRPNPRVSLALGAGGFSLPYTLDGAESSLSISAVDARARWHPWAGTFFLGGIVGLQSFSGAVTDTIKVTTGNGVAAQTASIDTRIEAKINSAYVTPHLGWLWVFKSGFTLGFELGVQIPVNPKTTLEIETDNRNANIAVAVIQATEEYQQMESDLKNVGNQLGSLTLPYVTAIRVGYMF